MRFGFLVGAAGLLMLGACTVPIDVKEGDAGSGAPDAAVGTSAANAVNGPLGFTVQTAVHVNSPDSMNVQLYSAPLTCQVLSQPGGLNTKSVAVSLLANGNVGHPPGPGRYEWPWTDAPTYLAAVGYMDWLPDGTLRRVHGYGSHGFIQLDVATTQRFAGSFSGTFSDDGGVTTVTGSFDTVACPPP